MATIEKFEDIEAWKSARELARCVYDLTRTEPFCRDFALCNQLRRALVSVVSNIAEGFERAGNKEFLQFLSVAKGSCGEVRAQLYIAFDQAYINEDEFRTVMERVVQTQPTHFWFYEVSSAV